MSARGLRQGIRRSAPYAALIWALLILGAVLLFCGCAHAETLDHLNQRVNAAIRPCDTRAGPCAPDFTPYVAIGDCKSYAATKRAELLKAGYVSERLAIWAMRIGPGEFHAVLVVDGAEVLDNRFPYTESRPDLERIGYVFMWPKPEAALTWRAPIAQRGNSAQNGGAPTS